jgi:hypothetical protein
MSQHKKKENKTKKSAAKNSNRLIYLYSVQGHKHLFFSEKCEKNENRPKKTKKPFKTDKRK